MAEYDYLCSGEKIEARRGDGSAVLYRGPFVLEREAAGTGNETPVPVLERALFDNGEFTTGQTLYYVKDYLGSVRVVVDASDGTVLRETSYYPYGGILSDSVPSGGTSVAAATSRYRYNGKEAQDAIVTGLAPTLDYGARWAIPSLGRWTTIDPLHEKYYGWSPYSFCANDPLYFMDKEGDDIYLAGKNESSVIIRTCLIDARVDLSVFDVDWGGQYQLDGDGYLTVALDIVGLFDQTGVADLTNMVLLFSRGEYLDGALSGISAIPVYGDACIFLRANKDIGILREGVRLASKSEIRLTNSLRKNMIRAYGEPQTGFHAHHIFPKKFETEFNRVGININVPEYGVWMESRHHLSGANAYNKEWELFLRKPRTREEILKEARLLMEKVYETPISF